MKKNRFLLILLFVIVAQLNCMSQIAKIHRDNLKLIDSYFNSLIGEGKVAGAITLISEDSVVVHLKAYGYKDIADSVRMDKDVLIPIASKTKVITTIAVLQLQEKGKFQIDDPIVKYIPEFKNIKVLKQRDSSESVALQIKPTIRDFLRHTSGMVYSGGNSYSDKLYVEAGFREWDKSLESFVKKVTELPLAFQPNKEWRYSYSHDVLGYLVEIVSGTPLNIYCKENIFLPLGLYNTDFYVPETKSDNLSDLYEYKEGLIVKDNRDSSEYNTLPRAISGGGGWWSSYGGIIMSIEDFHVLSLALLNYGSFNGTRILSENSVRAMISNQIGELDAYGFKYGLGVGVDVSEEELGITKQIFWAGAPYNTYFWIDYVDSIIGILFTNTAPFGHLGMMDKFKELTEKIMTE